ncbi:MAG: LamG domain-containing protein [Anaerolineae bacterium]|nr:LamG domain-containing protein [Anaerolineae bacterium]
MRFDGVDDFVQLPNAAALNLMTFTIVIWLEFDSSRPEDDWIISKGSLYGNFSILRTGASAQYWAGYASYAHVTQGGNWSSVASSDPLPIGQFFCLAISLDANNFRSYLNGRLTQSAANVSPPQLNDSPVYIGAGGYNDVNAFFRGVIDEVQIYGRVLSDSEVAQQCR